MKESTVLHILRNPYGYPENKLRTARIRGADLIEEYKDAYINLQEWAKKNGLDTTTYNNEI